ncbi:MAG: extracellular solute-binding protein [Chloroflexi bacterium]|nr:extracellular solute-binding protein [Chloroflexota bacterium]
MSQCNITRRRLLKTALVGAATVPAAGLLAACGSAPTPTPAPAKPAEAAKPAAPAAPAGPKLSGDIEFWSRETFDNGARQPLVEARLKAFDAKYGTNSRAQFMVFADSVNKTQAALAAGTPPDLGQQGPDVALRFGAAGDLLELDDVYKEMASSYLPLQKEAFVNWNGKAYSVPWHLETRVLFYHKDLLEKAGVKPPTTWQEWTDAAKALTKGDDQYGYIFNPEGGFPGQIFIPLGTSAGGNVLDKDGKVQSNTPEFEAALQFMVDQYNAKVMPAALPTLKQNDTNQLFLQKKAAMYIQSGALVQTIKASQPELMNTLGAVQIPVRKAGDISRSFLGGFQLFVFAKGKNTAGAKELLKWLLDPVWYEDYVKRTNGSALPATKAVAASDFYSKDPILSTIMKQIETGVRYGGPLYGNAPFLGEAEGKGLFSQPVMDAITGKRSVKEALAFMDLEIKKLAKQA